MRTKVINKNNFLSLAFIFAIIVHILFYVLFTLVFLKNKPNTSDQVILLNYNTFENLENKKLPGIPKQLKPLKVFNKKKVSVKKVKSFRKFDINIDSADIEKIDSLVYSINPNDSSILFDNFIIENPNLIALKIALKKNIENSVVKKTEAKITEERIRNAMFDYYKAKYPTPPYKFGERGTGNLINIPIDGIIELFK